MSDYIVSARKYRPTGFDSVVGQHALTTTLKNAIATGKLAHAYLFCGPRGVGKTTSARIFAKTINCLSPNEQGEACDHCESCIAFNEGRSYNIHELDAASNNGVNEIRDLIEQVQIPPQVGRYKVFIIDEVHMLSQAAFNAFLKTLEEPPAHAIFILATTEKHKILPTILSRCQIYDFNRMEVGDIVEHLKHVAQSEGYSYEEAALGVIARKADGGMRDALSIFDQVAAFSGGEITYRKVIDNLNVLDYDYYFALTDLFLASDIPQIMLTLNEILAKGFEAHHFMSGLASHLRDLLVSRDPQTLPLLEVAESVREKYAEQAARCTPTFLYRALRLCNDCDINYRTSNNKRLLVELTLIQVAQLLQEDEAPGCGRRPTRHLLPIFSPAPTQGIAAAPRRESSMPPVSTSTPSISTPTSIAPSAPVSQSRSAPPSTVSALGKGLSELQRAKLQTVSLRRPTQETAPDAAAASSNSLSSANTPQELQSTPFDQATLSYQWMSFALRLPREQSSVAMRLKNIAKDPSRLVLHPAEPGQPVRIEAFVENQDAARHLKQILPKLTAYLRRELHNDLVDPAIVVDTTQHIRPQALFPKEILAVLRQKSPHFNHLVEALQLVVS